MNYSKHAAYFLVFVLIFVFFVPLLYPGEDDSNTSILNPQYTHLDTGKSIPKTRQQIQDEAWALASSIKASAGRKTNPSLDGIGGTPSSQNQGDTTVADFNAGTHTNTVAEAGSVRLAVISGDDFDDNQIAAFWNKVHVAVGGIEPCDLTGDGLCAEETGGTYNMSYTESTTTREVQDYIWVQTNTGQTEYKTTILSNSWVRSAFGNFTILDSASGYTPDDAANLEIHRKIWIQGAAAGGTPATQRVNIWYTNTTGVTYAWNNGTSSWDISNTWSTNLLTIEQGTNSYFQVSIGRTTTEYYVEIVRVSDSVVIANATIALTEVREGSTGGDYIVVGDVTPNGRSSYGIATEMYYNWDNWTLTPATQPASGTFTSRIFTFGEWDAQLTQALYTLDDDANVDIQYRYSNNTDMTGATTWSALANNTDLSTSNLVGAFWQYRANFTTSAGRLHDLTWTYSSKSTGDAPSKDVPGSITQNSSWNYVNITLSQPQYLNLSYRGELTLWINNSLLDWGNYQTNQKGFVFYNDIVGGSGDTPYLNITLRITNSTIKNIGNMTWGQQPVSSWPISTMRVYLDNVTLDTFNMAVPGYSYDGGSRWNREMFVSDTNLTEYNKDDISYTALDFVTQLNRIYANNPTARSTGSIASNVRTARYNWFLGGYNQLVWQQAADAGGVPTEWVNWSYNLIENSTHTALGIYGQSPNVYYSPNLENGAYATLYSNAIFNSSYINIQTGGGLGNLTVKGNYLTGTATSFTESMGFNWRTNNFTVIQNYIWGRNSTNVRGIVVGGFAENVLVAENIIYDVGVRHLDFEVLGKKGTDGSSDYSWKGMNITSRDNYLVGAWLASSALIYQDSGTVRSINDLFQQVDASAGALAVELLDGWDDPSPTTGSYADLRLDNPYFVDTTDIEVTYANSANVDEVLVNVYRDTLFESNTQLTISALQNSTQTVTAFDLKSNVLVTQLFLETRYSVSGALSEFFTVSFDEPPGMSVISITNREDSTDVSWSTGSVVFQAQASGDYYILLDFVGILLPELPLDFTWVRSITGEFCFFVTTGAEDYTAFSWDFGDRAVSQETSPCHKFKEGTYNVTLSAMDSLGRLKIIQKTLTVSNGLLYIAIVVVAVILLWVAVEVNNKWLRFAIALVILYLAVLFFTLDTSLQVG
jgi:hypothetical protein